MRSIKVGQDIYTCFHWKTFPPLGAGEDAEQLRLGGHLTDAAYSRLKIWERDCSLKQMEASKCLSCPHHRRVDWQGTGPVLVDSDGNETPVLDRESQVTNRHLVNIFSRPGTKGSYQTAAWVPKDKEDG